MRKSNWTAIIEFEVVKPTSDIEKKGEKIKLSPFGEYCPDNSLRGYQLSYLLLHSKNYRPSKIVCKGVESYIING
jgi:apolipoprotein N-acyltransferase